MQGKPQKIGNRIRDVRKSRGLTQQEFARSIGIHRAYLSKVESNQNEPSEHLILSMCRVLGIGYSWLKFGSGERYEGVFPSRSEAVLRVIEEIHKRIESDRTIKRYDLFKLLDVDFKDPGRSLNLSTEFFRALYMLVTIFTENDSLKTESILSQLKAFMPKSKRHVWPQHDRAKAKEYRKLLEDEEKAGSSKKIEVEIELSPEVGNKE